MLSLVYRQQALRYLLNGDELDLKRDLHVGRGLYEKAGVGIYVTTVAAVVGWFVTDHVYDIMISPPLLLPLL